jgi:hypothetical protein
MISTKTFLNRWDRFFFKPAPVEGMAIFRIVWCALLLMALFFDIGNAVDFYGPRALLSVETVKSQFNYPHLNLFYFMGHDLSTIYFMMTIYGLALFSAMIGFQTRISLFVAMILMVSFHHRNIWLLSSSEVLMRIIMIFLVCSPAGNALSVDSFLARLKKNPLPREWAPWALRLIQIQLSVVYIWTVWHKLKGDYWLDGTAIYYATRLQSMTNLPVPVLLDNLLLIKLMTWGALILEFSLGTLVWFKEFRRPLIIMGVFFHIGIEYMMSIPFFELIMMALLLSYYTPEEMRAFANRWIESTRESLRASTLSENMKSKFLTLVS